MKWTLAKIQALAAAVQAELVDLNKQRAEHVRAIAKIDRQIARISGTEGAAPATEKPERKFNMRMVQSELHRMGATSRNTAVDWHDVAKNLGVTGRGSAGVKQCLNKLVKAKVADMSMRAGRVGFYYATGEVKE